MVLDVDSPGGGAPGSAELYASIRRVASEKPVVAYIRGVGASGAYYASCPAQRIVANPDALVGSIGVILLRPILSQLLQRLGVQLAVSKQGRLKDMLQPWREPTDEELERVQALIDDTYDAFVEAVARGRRMDEGRVRELATGEVFTGRQALRLGLVDELGDMETALGAASALGACAAAGGAHAAASAAGAAGARGGRGGGCGGGGGRPGGAAAREGGAVGAAGQPAGDWSGAVRRLASCQRASLASMERSARVTPCWRQAASM